MMRIEGIYADGLNSDLHTDFKLSSSGEAVFLLDTSGGIVDSVTFGTQITDASYGRDASNTWKLFYTSTPGMVNSGSSRHSCDGSDGGDSGGSSGSGYGSNGYQ